jgi:hypothetical protein
MTARLLALLCVAMVPVVSQAQAPARPGLDDHGFPLPEGAIARLGDLRFAQWGDIAAIAVSPD